jgi:mannitol/fructose-specific phosphotransferase system IIA component (Ntr-type)
MNKEDFRKQLLEAKTPKDILEIFRKEEAAITEG